MNTLKLSELDHISGEILHSQLPPLIGVLPADIIDAVKNVETDLIYEDTRFQKEMPEVVYQAIYAFEQIAGTTSLDTHTIRFGLWSPSTSTFESAKRFHIDMVGLLLDTTLSVIGEPTVAVGGDCVMLPRDSAQRYFEPTKEARVVPLIEGGVYKFNHRVVHAEAGETVPEGLKPRLCIVQIDGPRK